ncbi:MAG: ROK family protein [Oscillospiraceae bacterium]|nr:ROK family protein [Oscillospiraceae bacterium]
MNHDYMRIHNMSQMFDIIRSGDKLCTKRELQKATRLSWAAVSDATSELMGRGFIVEIDSTAKSGAGAGRPSKLYDIASDKNLLVGVDINTESLRIAVIDLKCRVVHSKSIMVTDTERDAVLSAVKKLIEEAVNMPNIGKENIAGIGFALMSSVDAKNGVARYSPHFKNWRDVKIKEIFEAEFGLPVLVEHDPNCFALAEQNIGAGKNISNIILLRLSLGIGMGMILNGRIYRDTSGNAGEFGHICMDRNGPVCSCGKRGCIEIYASVSGIAARYRESLRNSPDYNGIDDRSVDDDIAIFYKLARAAASGDALAEQYFDKAAEMLGLGFGMLITLMNPDKIVISGMFEEFPPSCLEKIKQIIQDTSWQYSSSEIMTSKLGKTATAIGAAALFIQHSVWEDLFRANGNYAQ